MRAMNTFVVDDSAVVVPGWVVDHESFRRWAHSDDFPESGSVCFLNGGVWVDMSKEQAFTHNQLKHEFAFVLTALIRAEKLGRYFPEGMLVSNVDAKLTSQPDGMFVSKASLATERVRLVEGAHEGVVELDGSPDMVLEVVSRSSVEKDTIHLVDQYWRAGIDEYWLADVRGQRLDFDIFRHGAKGFTPVRKHGGWLKSSVFNKSFRLTRSVDELEHPVYTLHVK